ncbi:efflux RND transporter permease subunit [Halioxenophilus sp. WMMB6]|uniref:efflux RND transporter permease subunit n=1 Tax=Halioxenophilus sp. WMMB6 TaxID=3073815 RepID=UPI00295F3D4D|nr:efflux RND transporter permease subunit [Halioxenophilus sp. WMMB6]
MKRCIAWFVDNPVASNLLMWLLLGGGLVTLPNLYREELPDVEMSLITVDVVYPQATATEVEQSVCMKLEDALAGLEGSKKLRATAAEGRCSVAMELTTGADEAKALREVKNRVDQIDSFPLDIERPVVSEVTSSYAVLQVALSGPADEATMKRLGVRMQRELLDHPAVSQVKVNYTRPEEISIEVSEQTLRQHQLTLADVAAVIERNSLNMPGGLIKGRDGQIILKTENQRYWRDDFESLVVIAKADGSRVTLGEIATIHDGFEDLDVWAHFDGSPAIILDIRRIGEEDVIEVAHAVKAYLQQAERWLPEGIHYQIWQDESQELIARIRTLGNNAISGLLLVIITLTLFMRMRLAFWVTAGIPIALCGSLLLFPALSISISTISVAAVMLVLGIVVDDAVVVGERIYSYQQLGWRPAEAAKLGAQEVSVPVIFGVLTTVATFLPLTVIPGPIGSILKPIGLVVTLILLMSLVESQWILPGHLAHQAAAKAKPARSWWFERLVDAIGNGLDRTVARLYRPALQLAIEWRYATIALAFSALLLTVGLMASGRVPLQFFPPIPAERLYASISLPEGSSVAATEAVVAQLQHSAQQLREEVDLALDLPEGESIFGHSLVSLGKQLIKGSLAESAVIGPHFAELALSLELPEDYSGPSPAALAARWRELTGPIPNAVRQSFDATSLVLGKPVELQLRGDDLAELDAAAEQVKAALYATPGVTDIYDSFEFGKQELLLTLLPQGHNLGLTTRELANQVRQAFYGEEVQRIQRGREEVKVFVRYPQAERASLGNLEGMRIRTQTGIEVPFASVARMELGRGFSKIERIDGRRVVNVIADVDANQITGDEVLAKLSQEVLPGLQRQYPQLDVRFAGEAEEQSEAGASLLQAVLLSLFLVYALLAIPLRSYLQPLLVMSAIPFGLVGAILGHLVLNEAFVFFSILGIVALSGVVINSALVLVDRINHLQGEGGLELNQAIVTAACERFRPIFLTTFTTFVGLVPLLSTTETSTRAMFVPMALSLSGGLLFSTLITLFLVPVLYQIGAGRHGREPSSECQGQPPISASEPMPQ